MKAFFQTERLSAAFLNSIKGLKRAFRDETACRQELILLFVMSPIALFFDIGVTDKILLISSLLVVLIVEILNTAIEAIVDLASPERHDLAGYAKDLGSAAVLLSLVLAVFVWGAILGHRYIF